MVDQASPVANSAEVQDVKTTIEKIHDLTREKSRIITDTNYKKYLPKKHKILRNIFQFWLLTIFLAVICTIVYFFPGLEAFKPLAYFGMIACFVYTLFAALIALVLFLTNYTLPIAVTNEVKARMVLNINRKLDTLKGMLQQGFGNAIIQLSIHEGKFDLDHSSASVDSFIKNNFPSGQYIKEILTDEIISKVQADIKHYIDKLSIVAKGHIKNQPVKVTQIASKMALKPEVVVQLFKHMLTKRTIDGMLTELDQEFVPESFMAGQDFGADDGTGSTTGDQQQAPVEAGGTTAASTAVTPGQGSSTGTGTAAAQGNAQQPAGQPVSGQTGLTSTSPSPVLVESGGMAGIPNIEQVKKDLENKRGEIESARDMFERGEIGIDQYRSMSNTLDEELEFIKFRLNVVKSILDPKKTCMVCFKPLEPAWNIVTCPNDHGFHLDCAQEYLQKHEMCPWCLKKVSSL